MTSESPSMSLYVSSPLRRFFIASVHFPRGHGVYFRLVLAVLLTALDICVDILSKEELCHFLIDVRSCGMDRDQDVLLKLYCNPYVLGIGALPPGITRQGLDGCSKLIRLGSRSHVVDVILKVLC